MKVQCFSMPIFYSNKNKNHFLHQRTPFHAAAEGGYLGLVKYFLEKGVDIDIKESFGVSALRLYY